MPTPRGSPPANLRRLILNESDVASVRSALQRSAVVHPGAFLADVRLRREGARAVVTAVYRTPVPFSPEQVALIEQALPRLDGDAKVELRIRSVPVTVASAHGYLYSSDNDEYGALR